MTVADLVAKGAVRKGELVKVLGNGELGGVKVDVTAHRFSGAAREKIAAAGGERHPAVDSAARNTCRLPS